MSNQKELDRELYIFGENIETKLGEVRFLTYKEYLLNMHSLSMISMNVLHIYYQYLTMYDSGDAEIMQAVESVKSESLYNIMLQVDMFKNSYSKIFEMVFDSERMVIEVMSDEKLFMEYRNLVMDMNMLNESEVSPDKTVQKYIEKSNRVKLKNSEKQNTIDLVSSVAIGYGVPYGDIANMTVLQVYASYYRIGAMKSYDTTVLFATVSEKVSIEAWNKSIDLFEKQSAGMKSEEFNKSIGGLFG